VIPLKDDSPSALKPFVTISLIVSCACVFLWQRSLDMASSRRAVAALGAIPAVLPCGIAAMFAPPCPIPIHHIPSSTLRITGMLLLPLLKRRDVALFAS
jgi:hypothetical protein